MTTERKHAVWSNKDHMRNKTMWYGGRDPVEGEMILYDPRTKLFSKTKVTYTPAWRKIADEIVVNAIDHWVKNGGVTYIKIGYDIQTGEITVKNNGTGIDIRKVKIVTFEGSGKIELLSAKDPIPKDATVTKTMYLPQLLFEHPMSGDNLDQTEDQITGGMNGVGAKLVNYLSNQFKITTVSKNKRYTQCFNQGSDIIHDPVIEPYDRPSYTKIEFIPNLEFLNIKDTPQSHNILLELVRVRAYQCAAFTGLSVYFNDELLTINNLLDYAKLHVTPIPLSTPEKKHLAGFKYMDEDGDQKVFKSAKLLPRKDYILTSDFESKYPMVSFKVESTEPRFAKYPWDIVISASDGCFNHMSLVNGIYVVKGGHHIDYIKKTLLKFLEVKIKQELPDIKVTPMMITNNIFIFMSAHIPGVDFDSQVKETLVKPTNFDSYVFTEVQLSKVWKLLQDYVMSTVLARNAEKSKRTITRKIEHDKLVDAYDAGKPGSATKCNLFVTEGDSAQGPIIGAIRAPKSTMPPKYNGAFTTGGKILNARKETTIIVNPSTNVQQKHRSKKFVENELLDDMVKILGLDFTKEYKYQHEYETLRYGTVIGATDQDTDGDHIFCLLMNFIGFFWPELIKRGYLKKLRTALIIVDPKSNKYPTLEFFTMTSFNETKIDEAKYKTPRYSKGLGSNNKDYIKHVFNNIQNYLLTIKYDSNAEKYLEIYYGKDPDLRKEELKTGVEVDETDDLKVKCSDFIRIYGKEFQKYDQFRHLPNNIDGLNASSRKIIYGALKTFSSNNEFKAVSNVGGIIKAATSYHHGEKSMEDTIIRLAQEHQNFGLEIPFFLQNGEFGIYSEGGHKHSSARYIKVKLNKICKLLFPHEDDFALEYNLNEDNEQIEPKCYVPVFPLSLFMYNSQPSTGYTNTIYPISFMSLYKNIKALITGAAIISESDFKINKFKWNGQIVEEEIADKSGKTKKVTLWSVGNYTFDRFKNMLHVTELPHYVYEKQYVNTIKRLDVDGRKSFMGKRGTEHDADGETKEKAEEVAPKVEKKAPSKSKGSAASAEAKKAKQEKEEKQKNAAIEDIQEETNNEQGVSIKIYLKPGKFDEIQEKFATKMFDGITEYFVLRKRIINKLNFIDTEGNVHTYKGYAPIFMDWFNTRKQIYIDRFDRYLIILNIKILVLQNHIRFCDNITVYGINSKTTTAAMLKILVDEKYDKIDNSLLKDNMSIKNDQLHALIVNSATADFNYITNLRISDTNEEPNNKRKAELSELLYERDELMKPQQYFKGASAWLSELEKIKELKVKYADGWNPGNPDNKYQTMTTGKSGK